MRQLRHEEISNQTIVHPLSPFCTNWDDPRNVGLASRLADAVGLQHLYLAGSTPLPPNTKINKTARSTVNFIQWSHHPNPILLVEE